MRKQPNLLAYIFLLLTVTFWAGNFIVGKYASLYEVPPFSLNFYRWFFAWLILAPFTLPEIIKKKEYVIQNYKLFIILGVTSITIFNSIVYYCFGHHHLGWTLGPISGKIVSGMIANENTNLDLKPYSSLRFS